MAKALVIKITEPITEADFAEASKLVETNIVFDISWGVDYYKTLTVGEILIIKDNGKVVAILMQRRPGKIFDELSEDHFDFKKYDVEKKDIGYISAIAVDPKYQKKSIGVLLVKKALELQGDFGSKAVSVHCMQSSPGNASEKLFTKSGFSPVKMHKRPWYNYSKKVGSKKYFCSRCGNPCICDDLEMVKYI